MSGIAPTFATFGKTAEPTEQGKVGFRYLSLSEKRTHKWFSSQEPEERLPGAGSAEFLAEQIYET